MTQLLHLTNSKTLEKILTFDLEHAADATQLTFHITARMDESKLRSPVGEERWVLLELLSEQVNTLLENHRRMPPARVP